MPRPSLRPRRSALAAERLEDRVNPVSFSTEGFWAGSNVLSVALGDFNGDGHPDIVAGTGGNEVEVYMNDGAGAYTPGANIPIGAPFDVHAADINGDAKVDIFVANSYGQQLSVSLGNGDGTFQMPIARNLPDNANGAAAADFDGDGDLDVVVADVLGAAVLINDGSADFFAPTVFYHPATSPGSLGVVTGDFNEDGANDFALIEYYGQRLDVYLNNGNATFASPVPYANLVPAGSRSILAEDFTGDGHLDFLVEFEYTPMLALYRGNGDGTFQAAEAIDPQLDWPVRLAAGDFDLDGDLDLVTMKAGAGDEIILLNNGDGTFEVRVVLMYGYPGNITVGDVNSDGLPDIITGHATSAGIISVSLNTTEVPHQFEVSAPATITAGEEFIVTVTARNPAGDVLTDYDGTVRFTSTDGEAFLPADYEFVSEDGGVQTFAVTLFTAGNQTISVVDTSVPAAGGSTEVEVAAGEFSALEIEAPDEVTTGEPFAITVTPRDEFRNLIADYAGTVHFTSTDANAQLPPDATLTGGVGEFTVVLSTPGIWTVSATDEEASIFAESGPILVRDPFVPPPTTIVADLGPNGLQRWTEAEGWVVLSPLNAQRAVLSADGSTVIADFGARGLRRWTEINGWLTISSANVEKALVSADGLTVMADFGGAGLRRWTEADGWTRLSTANVGNFFLSRSGRTTVIDLGTRGLRLWTEGEGISLITALNPRHVAVDADCTSLAADFSLIGLWRWTAANDEWVRLSPSVVEQVFVSDDGSSVVADFGHGGLRRRTDGNGWLKLSSLNAERVSISPNGTTVVADFGSRGLRRWTPLGWEILSTAKVQDAAVSSTGPVIADFGVDGLQVYDSSWMQLIGLDPEQILTV
jgi:hypothetical protein